MNDLQILAVHGQPDDYPDMPDSYVDRYENGMAKLIRKVCKENNYEYEDKRGIDNLSHIISLAVHFAYSENATPKTIVIIHKEILPYVAVDVFKTIIRQHFKGREIRIILCGGTHADY